MTRRGGGRDARVKERSGSTIHGPAFIRRKVNPYDLLTPDGLDLIEAKADQLLAEVGIDINETEDRELFRPRAPRSTATGCASSQAMCARWPRPRRVSSPNTRATPTSPW